MKLRMQMLGMAVSYLFFAAISSTSGVEYFVNKQGNNSNDGLTKEKSFLTIQRGVDAMKEGDTLTIGPGEYFETVKRDNLGGPEAETTIRAEIPGTVLLRGDVAAPEFKPVEGYRFIYSCAFDREVQAVNEVDTLTIMETAPSVVELEFTPGICFYDPGQKKLYISTSDMRPPDAHHYTVSVTKNYGLFLHRPERVIVEGIAATGYHSVDMQAGNPGDYAVSGILLGGGKHCVIRQCVAFLNANGIFENSGFFTRYETNSSGVPVYGLLIPESTNGPGGNLIEKCRAYGNYSRFSGSGGNICIFNSTNDVIRDCVSFGSATHGIRHYGSLRGPAIMINNLSWGNAINDLHAKGGTKDGVSHGFGFAERCVTLGSFHVLNVSHCIIGARNSYNNSPGLDNLLLNNHYSPLVPATKGNDFADPDNLDFRLQATSKFRGKSPDGSDRGAFQYETNIFYITPGGDDQADGLSAGKAWKTLARGLKDLKAGDTVYLEGGEYQADLELKKTGNAGQGVSIRGRGIKPVIIKGALRIAESDGIAFERLNFADGISIVKSKNISFNNCRMTGREVNLNAEGVEGLRVTHCLFAWFKKAALELKSGKNTFLSGNIFDNAKCPALRLDGMEAVRYSDYNSYRDAGAAWEVVGKTAALVELQKEQEKYSKVLSPDIKLEGGIAMLANQDKFASGGPNGTALGVYREFKEKAVKASTPVAHSVTPASANLEWWTSQPARCELGWGETPDCTNTLQFNSDGYCSFSLTGLKPNNKYFFRIIKTEPLLDPLNYLSSPVAPHPLRPAQTNSAPAGADQPLSFETAVKAADPVTYYVASDGSDRNNGLGRDKAFRTVNHAADKANAGDTVMIAGGVYKETVRVRATGLPDLPITFKSIPGEKVIFDSNNRMLSRAFVVSGKHHILFDGLYFRNFDSGLKNTGILCMYKSNGIRVTRCFNDGIAGYSPSFVSAAGCEDLVIRNCVAIGAMNGNLTLAQCPDALVENNVLLRSRIQQCCFFNLEEQKIFFRNNIITDNQPTKVVACMFEIPRMVSLVESNNCYFLRIPKEERRMFLFYRNEKAPMPYTFTNLSQITLLEYQRRLGETNSIAADPNFRAALEMKEAVDRNGKPIFFADHVLGKKGLDFPDLFATDPEVVRRGIGLQPEAFSDFHFNTNKIQNIKDKK
jgi:hypothetical protein